MMRRLASFDWRRPVRQRTAAALTLLAIAAPTASLYTVGHIPPPFVMAIVLALTWITFGRRVSLEAILRQPLRELRANADRRPKLLRAKRGAGYTDLVYSYRVDVDRHRILSLQDNLTHVVGRPVNLTFEPAGLRVRVADRDLPAMVSYDSFYSKVPPSGGDSLWIGIGHGPFGPIWADMTCLPHLLIGGTTGSGKTSWIRQTLVWLCHGYDPSALRIAAIDLKATEFLILNPTKHLIDTVAIEEKAATELLKQVVDELKRRQKLFAESGCIDRGQWNCLHRTEPLPAWLLVVDELAELTAIGGRGRISDRPAFRILSSLARLGRAFGIHLLLATQRPDANILPGQIKANLPATLAFRCRSEINSRILLGETNGAAAALPAIPGRAIWQTESTSLVQGVFIGQEDARRRLGGPQ